MPQEDAEKPSPFSIRVFFIPPNCKEENGEKGVLFRQMVKIQLIFGLYSAKL